MLDGFGGGSDNGAIDKLLKSLDLPTAIARVTIDLDDPVVPKLAKPIQAAQKKKKLQTREATLMIEPRRPKTGDWFYASSWARSSKRGYDPRSHHADAAWSYNGVLHTFSCDAVSEDFKRVVEENGFTGVEFIWIEDLGRYRAPQWYLAVAENPIGRGIDHPWFDRDKYVPDEDESAEYVQAASYFDDTCFRDEVSSNDAEKDVLIDLFRRGPGNFRVQAPHQALRSALPNTDFAFLFRNEHTRRLCFNQRVQDALVEAGVADAGAYRNIPILDDLPAGTVGLDDLKIGFPPPCVFRGTSLEEVRKESAARFADFDPSEQEELSPDIEIALAELEAYRRERDIEFGPGLSEQEIDEAEAMLPHKFPKAWRRVLRYSGRMEFGDFDTIPHKPYKIRKRVSSQILDYMEEMHLFSSDLMPDLIDRLLPVAKRSSGDLFALDISRVTPEGDCPVMSMTDNTPDRVLPSLAHFLYYAIERAMDFE